MKKLLRSFLIATASLGTIAGSAVAVISCGQKDNGPTDVSQYKNTLDSVSLAVDASGNTTIQNLPSLDSSLNIAWKYAIADDNVTAPADTSYKAIPSVINNLKTSDKKYIWIKLFSTNSNQITDEIFKAFQINVPATPDKLITISNDFVSLTKNTLLEFIVDPSNASNTKISKVLHIPQAPVNTKWQAAVGDDNVTAPTTYLDFSQVQSGTSLDEGKYLWIKLVPDSGYTLSNQATATKLICKTRINISPSFEAGYVAELQDGNSWIVANETTNKVVKYVFNPLLPDNRFQIDTTFGTSGIFLPQVGQINKIYKSGTGYLLVGVSGIAKITSSGQLDPTWNVGAVQNATNIVASATTSDGGIYFLHGTPGAVSFLDNKGAYSKSLNATGVNIPGVFTQLTNITTDKDDNAVVVFFNPLAGNKTQIQTIMKDGLTPAAVNLPQSFSNVFDVVKTSTGYFYFAAQNTHGNELLTAVFHLNATLGFDSTFGTAGVYNTNIESSSSSNNRTFAYYVDETSQSLIIGGDINSSASVQLERISFAGVIDTKFVSDQTDGKLVLPLDKLSGITRLNDNDYFLFSDFGVTKL